VFEGSGVRREDRALEGVVTNELRFLFLFVKTTTGWGTK
jgi:hypothetical protein